MRGTVIGLFRELDIGAVDLLGNLRDVVSTNGTCGRILLNLLERHIVRLHIACGCLGLTNDDSTARDARVVIRVVVEGIAGNKIVGLEVGDSVFVRLERPRTRRLHVGVLKVIVALVVKGGIVIDGELSTCKGGGTLREVARAVIGLLAVVFTKEHSHRVICGIVADRELHRRGFAIRAGNICGVNLRIGEISLGSLGLLHIVASGIERDGVRVPAFVCREGRYLVRAVGVSVDPIFGTCEGIAAIGIGKGLI